MTFQLRGTARDKELASSSGVGRKMLDARVSGGDRGSTQSRAMFPETTDPDGSVGDRVARGTKKMAPARHKRDGEVVTPTMSSITQLGREN